MATPNWIGVAADVAQVDTLTIGGTLEVGDILIATIGGKSLSYSCATTTLATEATSFAAAWNTLDSTIYPEFAEITAAATSGGALTLTGDVKGKPFTVTVSTTESNGGAADLQTFVRSATTACTGKNFWDNANNWSTGAVPVTGDTVYIEKNIPILYGLGQSAVTLTALHIPSTFTSEIGLPRIRGSGATAYNEYRDTYLAISATTIYIGQGAGSGSGRIKIDTGSVATTIHVNQTGQPLESNLGIESVLWKGTHASNALYLTKGSVGVAKFATETANLSGGIFVGYEQQPASDARLWCGAGLTSTTVKQNGGVVEMQSNVTTVTKNGGEMILGGTATLTTLHNRSGNFYDESTGTFTTVNNEGYYDTSRALAAKTITTLNLFKGSNTQDPNGRLAVTNPITGANCIIGTECTINFGKGRTLTLA